MQYAPVALFVFKRLEHTVATIKALQLNEYAACTRLYVFCDGPRDDADRAGTAKVRAFVRDVTGFESVVVTERNENFGLARSIITGVSEVMAAHGCGIVVEDDCVTSPHFLRYMNDGLRLYADEPRVASIHAYTYPVDATLPETFFLRGTDCWGWATWARAWSFFEPDPHALLAKLAELDLEQKFDLDGSYGYTQMLKDYAAGLNDSWAIRWHASAYVRNLLTLFPGRSLVLNIGLDSSGSNCVTTTDYNVLVSSEPVTVAPISIEESALARNALISFYRKMHPAPTPSADARVARSRSKLWNWLRPHTARR